MFLATNGIVISGSSYSTRTQAFATATGITDVTILNALNTFDLGLISNGLDTKMKALYPFVGGTSTTNSFNFMNTAQYQITWYGGMTFNSNGITGNGVNGYGNTNFSNDLITSGNTSIGIYSRTELNGGNYAYMGARGSNNSISTIFPRTSNIFSSLTNGWYTDYQTVSNTSSLGFFQTLRTSSTQVYSVKNNTSTGFTRSTYGAVNGNFCLLQSGINNGASNEYITPANLSFAYIGDGITSSESITLYTLVQDLQTSLSRQV